ncbi:MAG: carboxypeptidase-like regulatory domain-containing protein [Patescibacteria group bacterium]
MLTKNKKAFSLLEILISIAILSILALGIYAGINLVLKIVFQSRIKIIENGILNEQVEIIRNMSFYDVGIINSSPVGLLERNVVVNRNGIDFNITRTIRNIDDEYDGTIDGEPQDLTPADYKIVEIEITCGEACGQKNPLNFVTYISPKFLEGNPNNGALFIKVFDADAAPVQGAEVHIVATSTSSTLDMIDTTDNEGMLKLVDLEAAFEAYNITVSKTGFTVDKTFTTSEIENPIKPPVSVEAQNVTTISFSIDEVSSVNLNSLNSYCSVLPSVPINIFGTKLLGINPDYFKLNENIVTNGGGNYYLNNLEWDSYGLKIDNYDLIGTIPSLPIKLLPGATQDVKLILAANSGDSILVNVQDSITNQPISNATVTISGNGLNKSKVTGVGFVRQSDWSGGDGQENFLTENKFWSVDTGIDYLSSLGDLKLNKAGENYLTNGILESSIFDLGVEVNFVNFIWEPLGQPDEVGQDSVKFQLATNNTSTPEVWNYFGPDGTENTFYDSSNISINSIHNGDRFARYKIFLSTDSVSSTPTVSDISLTYITSCTPPGQAYFGSLTNSSVYTIEVSAEGYQTKTETVTANGDIVFEINLSAE